jgi:hypothetical protein
MLAPSPLRRAALGGILLLSLAAALSGTASGAQGGLQRRRFNIDGLSWLAGSWKGTISGGEVDQTWTPPAGRTMMGTNRVISNRRTVLRQFFVIEQSGDGITLSMRAVGEKGTDLPENASFLRLVSLSSSEAVFESPGELTRRMTYRLDPDGALSGRVDTFRSGGGGPERIQFRMQRVTDR